MAHDTHAAGVQNAVQDSSLNVVVSFQIGQTQSWPNQDTVCHRDLGLALV